VAFIAQAQERQGIDRIRLVISAQAKSASQGQNLGFPASSRSVSAQAK
jgi:hypothetical protein